MFDFMMISNRPSKRGVTEIYPKFIITRSRDLMIRGGDFYAIWVEERGLWSTDEHDVYRLIDRELDAYAKENEHRFDGAIRVLHMWDAESGMVDRWHKYCQNQMRDSFHMLDEKIIFANTETGKEDYASKKLPYPLEEGKIDAWDKIVSTLYSDSERHKIEWSIGAIVSGAARELQKFAVFYGAAGTGKSTIINIIQKLFDGYTGVFDARALGSSNNSFALEAFRKNPLVGIQHDGDLSRIEDNTRLNSLVSHERMTVNEKFKSTYDNSFKCFLFMGTNKPVKITDAKSGLIRRLIDITPSGNKLEPKEYRAMMKLVDFELGHIAKHCMDVYLDAPDYYDDYIPLSMMSASNDFYNFVQDAWAVFDRDDETTLKAAWEMYKNYCEDAKIAYPYSQRAFKEELKNYFRSYHERHSSPDGTRVRSWYGGFRSDRFEEEGAMLNEISRRIEEAAATPGWLEMIEQKSLLDDLFSTYPAQYATEEGTPLKKWANVDTFLRDLDTSKLHFVRIPINHIVIDFDISDRDGNKLFERNLEEAAKWPPTYAEVSKSGKGIHLHYIYIGDPTRLSRIYDDQIEIKVFSGYSSLRRMVTRCNDVPVASISSGLPLKEEIKIVNMDSVKSERGLRTLIRRNLNKEIHDSTKCSIDFIYKILDDAYKSDLKYDVRDMFDPVLTFAMHSTNNADYCMKLVSKMKFASREESAPAPDPKNAESPIIFYDVEVFPNLFLVNWKAEGEGKPVVRMINPDPKAIEELLRMKLVGFNCRKYDNHILYARLLGYSNEGLYNLSKNLIDRKTGFFGEAYNISYTDVYDFSSKKQSLKKFEIELGIHHQELGLPWDEPVPEEKWPIVAEYCDYDVLATEAVFNARRSDFLARQMLAHLAGMTVNDTTNTLTGRIIFGQDRNPQKGFNYRNLALPVRT